MPSSATSNTVEFAFSEDDEWEGDSLESDEDSDEEENIQYVELTLALAEGAARKEGVDEGRRQGAVFGALLASVIVVILASSFNSPPPAEL